MHVLRSYASASSFPSVVDTSTGFNATSGASQAITMPAGGSNGDLWFVEVTTDGGTETTTSSSGWTKIGSYGTSAASTLHIFAGIKGTAAALTVNFGVNTRNTRIVRTISTWSGSVAGIQASSVEGNAFVANIDPPSFSPTGGSKKWLWIACAITGTGASMPTAGPSGWSGFTAVQSATSSLASHMAQADAWLQQEAATVNPGPFTHPSQGADAVVFVIPPIA